MTCFIFDEVFIRAFKNKPAKLLFCLQGGLPNNSLLHIKTEKSLFFSWERSKIKTSQVTRTIVIVTAAWATFCGLLFSYFILIFIVRLAAYS